MLCIYRQDELRTRYPCSTVVIESDDGLYATVKNPLSRDWWQTWVLAPEWAGMRWRGIREGLTLVRIRRFSPGP